MSRYIASAFVKIRTRGKREAVLNSLRKGRIRLDGNKKYLDCDYLFFTKNKYGIMQKHDIKSQSKNSINCNHFANGVEDLAIALFLELAHMRDGTTSPKYVKFIQDVYRYHDSGEHGVLEYCDNEVREWQDLFNCEPICYYWINASPLDVAKAVMRGDIKL